MFTLLTFGCPS